MQEKTKRDQDYLLEETIIDPDYRGMTLFHGGVVVGGELVVYERLCRNDRTADGRLGDGKGERPEGNIIVIVPGHGQTVKGPRNMTLAAARLSRSGIAWCMDPVPARGGDEVEARAIALAVKEMIEEKYNRKGESGREPEPPVGVTFVGQSHGGAEALRAADEETGIPTQFLGLCPAGLVQRRAVELLWSFTRECGNIFWNALRRGGRSLVGEALRMMWDIISGISQDVARSGEWKRIREDINWACKKVVGEGFKYDGEAVLLFGNRDIAVRWRDVFPRCEDPGEIPEHLDDFRRRNFPYARLVEVAVLEGDHLTPEADAESFLRPGLEKLGQLDDQEPAESS